MVICIDLGLNLSYSSVFGENRFIVCDTSYRQYFHYTTSESEIVIHESAFELFYVLHSV